MSNRPHAAVSIRGGDFTCEQGEISLALIEIGADRRKDQAHQFDRVLNFENFVSDILDDSDQLISNSLAELEPWAPILIDGGCSGLGSFERRGEQVGGFFDCLIMRRGDVKTADHEKIAGVSRQRVTDNLIVA